MRPSLSEAHVYHHAAAVELKRPETVMPPPWEAANRGRIVSTPPRAITWPDAKHRESDVPGGWGRNGCVDPRARLGGHLARCRGVLAAELAHRGAPHAQHAPPHVHLLGRGRPLLLQRRLPAVDRTRPASRLAGPAGARSLGRDLARHRAAGRAGHAGARRHLEREPADPHHSGRAARRRVLDLQLRPDRRRRRAARRGRRAGSLHGDDPADPDAAPACRQRGAAAAGAVGRARHRYLGLGRGAGPRGRRRALCPAVRRRSRTGGTGRDDRGVLRRHPSR